jgi:hypothetical protein
MGTIASAKTSRLTFRIKPGLKDAMCTDAVNEHHSIANMIAVMIRDCCGRVGVAILATRTAKLLAKIVVGETRRMLGTAFSSSATRY